ncbi:uncharacterized protein LOC121778442 [Salvia splendens]|uniref:uncharacterized protein LOC121778442 n=1 Tax=Salvia splendens TaxID=180675 RepID=UPI001C258680|nr:uncharacterized protein LOC121778442 [Salvia splendens]
MLRVSMATHLFMLGNYGRCNFDLGGCWSGYGKEKMSHARALSTATGNAASKKTRLSISPLASSALAESRNSSAANFYKEVLEAARDKFTREISFQSKDKDISLAKALLYVGAEDEAFLAFNREIDICSAHNERRDTSLLCDGKGRENVEAMSMADKNINEWLAELDAISRGCHLAEVLEAVNKVLFESRSFRRSPVIVDPKCSYLHSALSSGCASGAIQDNFRAQLVWGRQREVCGGSTI